MDFFSSLIRHEMGLSVMLAHSLQEHVDARLDFLERVEAGLCPSHLLSALQSPVGARLRTPDVSNVCARLREESARSEGGDVEVALEANLANDGNIDIALFSRRQNAVLAVEVKTGTSLSKGQVTKYLLALRDSDPYEETHPSSHPKRRSYGAVLLRPMPMLWPLVLNDTDFKADPSGVRDSSVVTFSDLNKKRILHGDRLPETLGLAEAGRKYLDECGERKTPVVDSKKQLAGESLNFHKELGTLIRDWLSENHQWSDLNSRGEARSAIEIRQRADRPDGWKVSLSKGVRDHIKIHAPRDEVLRCHRPPAERAYLWHFCASTTVSVPEPFPAGRRPWDPVSDRSVTLVRSDLQHQVLVFERFFREALGSE
jgi:hypothetical protein